MKKLISFILCTILLLGTVIPISSVFAASDENLPTVYVGGRGTMLVDKDGKKIFDFGIDTNEYAKEQAKEILPLLAEAIITNNYDEYCDRLYEAVATLYDPIRPNDDGEVVDGSYQPWSRWTENSLRSKVKAPGVPYGLGDYTFYYDWRLDPYATTADELNEYINAVLKVTGAPKINIVGRCYGGNVVSAYFAKYGCKKVNKCVFYVTTAASASLAGQLYSGQINLESKAIARYVSDLLGDEILDEFIRTSVNLAADVGGLNVPVSMIDYIYGKVASNVVPRLVYGIYGMMPSYWSLIGDEYFEAAKKFVFGGQEERFAKMIEKIDACHENVTNPFLKDIERYAEEDGLDIYSITKYGIQVVPVTDVANEIGDNTIEVSSASFGATCSPVAGKLSKSYINAQTEKGLERYISPDKQIDASTCLFRDKTWFIKNSEHSDFNSSIDNLLVAIIRYDGSMTVNDNADYPQFMVQDNNRIIHPMDDSNMNIGNSDKWASDRISIVIRWLLALIRLLASKLLG